MRNYFKENRTAGMPADMALSALADFMHSIGETDFANVVSRLGKTSIPSLTKF
jgi:hypothetical protein